jgi:hypothetical protein
VGNDLLRRCHFQTLHRHMDNISMVSGVTDDAAARLSLPGSLSPRGERRDPPEDSACTVSNVSL